MSVDWIPDYMPCPQCGALGGIGLIHNKKREVCVGCICGLHGPGAPAERWSKEVDVHAVEAWNNLDRSNSPMSDPEIEQIARAVYAQDQFTPADAVWCNRHWLNTFARAVEAHIKSKA